MVAKDPDVRSVLARIAIRRRWHPDRPIDDLERDLRAARVEAQVRRVAADAHALTPAQRAQPAELLADDTSGAGR